MQCECKSEIEMRLLARFKEQAPNSESHAVALQGYVLTFGEKLNEMACMDFKATHVVIAKNGNRREKSVKQSMFFNYCPFCGRAAK